MLTPDRLEIMGNRQPKRTEVIDEDGNVHIKRQRDRSTTPGRLAQAILDHGHADLPDLIVEAVHEPEDPTVLVYCRKTDLTLKKAAAYCNDTETPLLFLSSGIDTSELDTRNFPFVHVPNAALNVIHYLGAVEEAARHQYAGWSPSIVEHHQEAKADTSGTAKKLADMLGIEHDGIVSVRDFDRTQQEYAIPDSSRDGYAIHSVTFTNPETEDVSEPLEIVVNGRSVYAEGVFDIYNAIELYPQAFKKGPNDIVTLVQNGIVRTGSKRR